MTAGLSIAAVVGTAVYAFEEHIVGTRLPNGYPGTHFVGGVREDGARPGLPLGLGPDARSPN